MSNASRFWWLPLALFLSACQQAPLAPTDFTRAEQIQRWEMSGKLGYRTADDGGSAAPTAARSRSDRATLAAFSSSSAMTSSAS